jgi:ABC-type nitrate/sulfonate/bicarbonate transport system permease component
MNAGRKGVAISVISVILFIAVWQAASESGLADKTLFPPPTEVLIALAGLLKSGELLIHIKASLWRVLLGLAIGGLAGTGCGLLTGRIVFIEKSLNPILNVMRSFPPVAIIPLVIVWFGIGETAKLFSISFGVFFPVWVSTHTGAAQIPEHYLQVTATLTNSLVKKWFNVILPASLPFIIAGIRCGIGVAFIMVFVSELAGASSGLGYLISISHLAYRIDRMIAGLIVLGLFGALTDYLFVKITYRMFPWIGKT